ncbi:HU family DNA-binding protein [Gymnodinialimonas hymeniacidonis]|uniref:HU family DNA-binding protein n=1 Tax=Gymnodinialimonas hymeniacidonis TaxID=3126508 RepID=UPI0034C6AADF
METIGAGFCVTPVEGQIEMATKTTSKAKSTTAKATSAGRRKSTTSTKKSSTTSATAAKAAAPTSPAAPAPKPAAEVAASTATDALRRPDLIQAVADRVSLKRSEAKMVFDVVLDEIGKALDANEEVIVPPLGKLMVKKRLEKPNGEMLTLKLKRAAADPTAGDVAPLAKPDEEG